MGHAINSRMSPRILYYTIFPLIWIACWLFVAGVSAEAWPTAVGVEQQALSVAWAMWRDSAFLTPWTDGVLSPVDFPMVPWVINLGWAFFGVSDWWAHAMGFGFGLLGVFLTAGLARILWPGWTGLGAMCGTTLSAMFVWIVCSGVLEPTVVAVSFQIGSTYALVWTWRTGRWDGFVYFGLAMAGGALTIGPLVWLTGISVALLAPLWGAALAEQPDGDQSPPHGWRNWYIGVLAGSGLSIAIVAGWFGWMLAADFATVDFLIQRYWSPVMTTAPAIVAVGKIADTPWWHFLLIVCGMLLPWVAWPPAWRALLGVVQLVRDGGARLSMIWIVSVLLPVIVLPNQKLANLVLILPAMAMVMAFLIFHRADKEAKNASASRSGETGIGLMLVLAGAGVVVAPYSGVVFKLSWWVPELAGSWGVLLILLGVATAYAMPRLVDLRMMAIAVIASLAVVVAYLVVEPLNRDYFDTRPVASYVSEQISGGSVVAFAGFYGGELDFVARLNDKLPVLAPDDPIGTAAWVAGNPDAIIAQLVDNLPPETQTLESFPYGNRYIVFWSGEAVGANPTLLEAVNP